MGNTCSLEDRALDFTLLLRLRSSSYLEVEFQFVRSFSESRWCDSFIRTNWQSSCLFLQCLHGPGASRWRLHRRLFARHWLQETNKRGVTCLPGTSAALCDPRTSLYLAEVMEPLAGPA